MPFVVDVNPVAMQLGGVGIALGIFARRRGLSLAIGLLLVALVAGRGRLERLGPGATAGAYLFDLSAIRFALFFLRDEPPVFLGLKAAQWIGLGLGAAGLAILAAGIARRPVAASSLIRQEVS